MARGVDGMMDGLRDGWVKETNGCSVEVGVSGWIYRIRLDSCLKYLMCPSYQHE